MDLHWIKSLDDSWLDFNRVNLTGVRAFGVYIIWHGGSRPRVVRVGQGDIAAALLAHRENLQITRYEQDGPLMVTWAVVQDAHQRAGIEKHLVSRLSPLVAARLEHGPALEVRTPFG